MKEKLIICAAAFLMCFSGYAQREQRSNNFSAELSFGVSGDYVYNCMYTDNGNVYLDGPFTMKGDLSMSNIRVNYLTTGSVKVDYNLSGTHSKGYLNGPLQMTANVNVKMSNGSTQTDKYSFVGNFKKGFPNGNFKVNYKEGKANRIVNVTYKDTIFVGTYHCHGFDHNSWEYDYKGTFTQDGKMTGTWNLNNNVSQYQNGVRVSGYGGNLGELAKKYASGTISKEKLLEDGIFVMTDSLDLGDKATSIILSDKVHWEKLGYYDFSHTSYIKYEYLHELSRISDGGVDKLISNLIKALEKNNMLSSSDYPQIDLPLADYYKGMSEFANYIMFDKKKSQYYIEVGYQSSYRNYCRGGSLAKDFESTYRAPVYLTEAQLEKIRTAVHAFRTQHVISRDQFAKVIGSSDPRPEYFAYCPYDNNYILFDWDTALHIYVDVSLAEDYMIKGGRYDYVLDNAPETRKGTVLSKVNAAQAKKLRIVKDRITGFLDGSIALESNTLDQFCSSRHVSMNYGTVIYDYEDFFPLFSYELGDLSMVRNPNHPEALYKADFKFNVLKGDDEYKSYQTVLYVDEKHNILFEMTYSPDTVKSIKSPFDHIDEMSGVISQNIHALKLKAATDFPQSWTNMENSVKSMDFTKNFKDPEGSLNRYESILSQTQMMDEYVDGLCKIRSIYGEIDSKYGKYADAVNLYQGFLTSQNLIWTKNSSNADLQKILEVQNNTLKYFETLDLINRQNQTIGNSGVNLVVKQYSVWFQTIDLTWSAEYDSEYHNGVIQKQQATLEIIDKYNEYADNDAKLSLLKSASKNIHKLYVNHLKSVDLSWKKDTDGLLSLYNDVLFIQQKCIAILSDDNIDSISEAVKKSKPEDIMQVIKQYGSSL